MEFKKKHSYLISRLNILNQELSLAENIASDAAKSFQKAFNRVKNHSSPHESSDASVIEENANRENSIPASDSGERVTIDVTKKQKDPEIKKAFRAIAKVIHPDKITNLPKKQQEQINTVFKKAQEAAANGDFFTLMTIINELELELPEITREKLDFLKKTIKSKEHRLEEIRQTYAWVWYHEDSVKIKEQIMNRYIKVLKEMQNDPWS